MCPCSLSPASAESWTSIERLCLRVSLRLSDAIWTLSLNKRSDLKRSFLEDRFRLEAKAW